MGGSTLFYLVQKEFIQTLDAQFNSDHLDFECYMRRDEMIKKKKKTATQISI